MEPADEEKRGGMNPKEIIDLAISLTRAHNVEDILGQIEKKILDFFDAEGVRVYQVDAENKELFGKIRLQDDFQKAKIPVSNTSIAGYTAQTKTAVLINDLDDPRELEKYPGLLPDKKWEKMFGTKASAVISVPILYRDVELQGIIQIINQRVGTRFESDDIEILKAFGNLVAEAIFHQSGGKKYPTKFDLLLKQRVISRSVLDQSLQLAEQHAADPLKGDAATILVEQFNVSASSVGESLSKFYHKEYMPFTEEKFQPSEIGKHVSGKYLRNNLAVPLYKEGDRLFLVMDDPSNDQVIAELKKTFKVQSCKIYVGLRRDILKYLDLLNGKSLPKEEIGDLIENLTVEEADEAAAIESEEMLEENAPVIIKTINKIISDGYEKGASDIHIEPRQGRVDTRIRLRLDGVCFEYTQIPYSHTNALTNRIKIMSKLKIDEHRFPQSGKIQFRHGDKKLDLRVEVTPLVGNREEISIRILSSSLPFNLNEINLSDPNHHRLLDMVSKPYGIFLVVGPTGSGKTTTLHSILRHLNTPEKKIWTAEDPVEIIQEGISQVQVNPNIKPEPFNFAKALRSFLRADPDIIMIGEMRDVETAKTAIEASLTGHLVLSTLHTNNAPDTITRLIEMGMNSINLSDAFLGILAQRLIRTLCPECKQAYTPKAEEIEELLTEYGAPYADELGMVGGQDFHLYQPLGCPQCNVSGFKGRTGIHELLSGTKGIKKLIRERASVEDIRQLALKEGMRTLKMDGIRKVMMGGQTVFDQVMKVCVD